MGFSSGLGATLGMAMESTYGTFKKPSKFFEFESAPLKGGHGYLEGKQLGAGNLFLRGSRYQTSTETADGTTTLQIPTEGFGAILNMLHGETITPAKQEATTAYLQTHPIGLSDPSAKSATLQVREPMITGETIEPFSYLGMIVMKFEVTVAVGGFATCVVTWDGQSETRSEEAATVELPSNLESWTFAQAELKVNGTARKLSREFKLDLTIPRDTNLYHLSAAGKKSKPILNSFVDATMSMTDDYGDNVIFDFFTKSERKSVELILKGATIATTFHKELKFSMAECGFDDASPQVTGPDIIKQAPKVKALYNGSVAPIVATYMSTDASV